MRIYLASPYSDPDDFRRRSRYWKATEAAAWLAKEGHAVYAPITMTRPMECVLDAENIQLDHAAWMKFDKNFMEFCDELWVLMLPGWESSKGVKEEIEYFRSNDKPVRFLRFKSDWKRLMRARITMEPV